TSAGVLSLCRCARPLGEPQSFVSNYERGQPRIDVLELLRIVEVLGIFSRDAEAEGAHVPQSDRARKNSRPNDEITAVWLSGVNSSSFFRLFQDTSISSRVIFNSDPIEFSTVLSALPLCIRKLNRNGASKGSILFAASMKAIR